MKNKIKKSKIILEEIINVFPLHLNARKLLIEVLKKQQIEFKNYGTNTVLLTNMPALIHLEDLYEATNQYHQLYYKPTACPWGIKPELVPAL